MLKSLPRKSNSVLKRILLRTIKFTLLIGLPVFLFIIFFKLEEVTIEGSTHNTPELVKEELITSGFDSNALVLYLKHKYFKKIEIPFVEKLDIELIDSHSVYVRVYEKVVTGCVEFMGEYLYFDKDGIIVESTSERLLDIPRINGLRFDSVVLGKELRVNKEALFDVILELTQLNDKYDLGIDTISFNSDYEVTVDCGNIKASIGKRDTYDEVLAELKSIIAKAEGMNLELDLSKFKKGDTAIIAKPITPSGKKN